MDQVCVFAYTVARIKYLKIPQCRNKSNVFLFRSHPIVCCMRVPRIRLQHRIHQPISGRPRLARSSFVLLMYDTFLLVWKLLSLLLFILPFSLSTGVKGLDHFAASGDTTSSVPFLPQPSNDRSKESPNIAAPVLSVGIDKIIRIDLSTEGHMSPYIHETLS